jgi:hypothetical protein
MVQRDERLLRHGFVKQARVDFLDLRKMVQGSEPGSKGTGRGKKGGQGQGGKGIGKTSSPRKIELPAPSSRTHRTTSFSMSSTTKNNRLSQRGEGGGKSQRSNTSEGTDRTGKRKMGDTLTSTTGTEVDGADETFPRTDSFDQLEDEDEEDLTLAGNQGWWTAVPQLQSSIVRNVEDSADDRDGTGRSKSRQPFSAVELGRMHGHDRGSFKGTDRRGDGEVGTRRGNKREETPTTNGYSGIHIYVLIYVYNSYMYVLM